MNIAVIRRAGWGFADQALSSLTNFGVGVLVARTVGREDFGAFSLAFATYLVALISSRALSSEPLVIRHSHGPHAEWRRAAAGASALALLAGVIGGAVVAVISVLTDGPISEAFLGLALVLPGLLLQDMWRFAFVAQGKVHRAFLCDLTWIVLLVPALLWLGEQEGTTLLAPMLVWGGSAAVGGLVGVALARTLPSPRLIGQWWRANVDIGPRYVAEALVSMASQQLTIYALGALVGLAAAGALRGAQLLLGPMQVILMGLTLIAIPEGSRVMKARGPGALLRPSIALSLGVLCLAAAWAVALLVLPDSIGVAILGASWAPAREILLPLSIAYAGMMSSVGAGIGLRVLADARRSLRARTYDASAQVVGGISGALIAGTVGAAVGLAIGAWIGTTLYWLVYRMALRAAVEVARTTSAGPLAGPRR
jgi:O-antigen/teichoic acid export membrane protein